jgi:small GTP-binding protein
MTRIETQIQKKICMLGEFSVGKTSLVERFVYERFDDRYLSTIGVKISRKSVEVDKNTMAHLLLWDLAGGEEFSGTQTSYLRGAAGALLVCDLTRTDTLSAVAEYAQQLLAIQPKARMVIVANKSDLTASREIDPSDLEKLAEKLKAPLFITSAKTGDQVEEAFFTLAKEVVA